MVKIANIALFQAHESMEPQFQQLFSSRSGDFTVTRFTQMQQVIDSQRGDTENFDLIIVPLLLHDRSSAVTVCIQAKSDPLFAGVPIIAISHIKDIAAITTLYGAGADVVMVLPVDFEHLNSQINSLCRLSRSLIEEQEVIERDKGLRQAIISALHFVDEALVILDTAANVVFTNHAAKQMLNLFDDQAGPDPQKAHALLQAVCKRAMEEIETKKEVEPTGYKPVMTYKNETLIKNSGENLKVDIRVTELRAINEETIAYCLSITDISAPGELSNTLLQAEQTQFISLLLAAASMRLMGTQSLGTPLNALSRIEEVFSREDPSASLNVACTSLLEFIDNFAYSSQILRLEMSEDAKVAMRPSHLFLLIGNIVLFSLKGAVSKSETTISYRPSGNSYFGTLTVHTHGSADFEKTKEKITSSVIRSEFLSLAKGRSGEASTSLEHARKLAATYKLEIVEKRITESEVIIEVDLPIAV